MKRERNHVHQFPFFQSRGFLDLASQMLRVGRKRSCLELFPDPATMSQVHLSSSQLIWSLISRISTSWVELLVRVQEWKFEIRMMWPSRSKDWCCMERDSYFTITLSGTVSHPTVPIYRTPFQSELVDEEVSDWCVFFEWGSWIRRCIGESSVWIPYPIG